MTRFPRPGSTKTRLIPRLGDQGAAALHAELALHCIRRMHATALSGAVDLEVHASGASVRRVRRWLCRGVDVREQCGGDLGSRLTSAARHVLASGAPSVTLVGSDAPGLGGAHIRAALAALREADVVLGPATDGGYYLVSIAATRAAQAFPALFGPHVPWGTSRVLEVNLTAARESGLAVHLLEPLSDVDRPEDIVIWERITAEKERTRRDPRLTVVIPALNEETGIAATIESARGAGAHEIVVADGGSRDRTVEVAAVAGARIVHTERGRARQMNAGAATASGDVLLFLHADTTLPADALGHVRRVLADPDVALGSFRFAAGDPADRLDRAITLAGDWRQRLFGLPYGDQAQFVRASDFADLGGYPELPVMEDYEFALRCQKLGRLAIAPVAARTSARAWHDHGLLRTALTNAAVILGYRAGVSAERLASWRHGIANRSEPAATPPGFGEETEEPRNRSAPESGGLPAETRKETP